ncbi:MAG: SAP domain-containing protein [Candidatus Thermoplasmatota archaeon]|nr:SAP domain-containing protein [Candidatus Thermoplasmatota archaeon]
MYQLGKAAFEQVVSVDETEAGNLFDELLADFEEDEEDQVIDWSKGSFTMDDVTIDVEQYGDDDGIKLSDNPTFAITVDHPDSVDEGEDEDYQLTSADAPKFVTKFEVPETELEPLEEVQSQQIELIQPTATSPETVPVVATDEKSDNNGEVLATEEVSEVQQENEQTTEEEVTPELEEQVEEISEQESLLGLKKVELVEIASDKGLATSGTKAELVSRILESDSATEEEVEPEVQEELPTPPPPIAVPSTPAGLPVPPPVSARPVDPMDAAFDGDTPEPAAPVKQTPPKIPKIPKLPHIEEANSVEEDSMNNGFWPWPQQEEWSNRDVAMKIKEAMEAAKSSNMAQSTVLLDEVGPHLGDRTKLLYPVGALLQRIGRAATVDRMLEVAMKNAPDDPHVQTAKAKLRP